MVASGRAEECAIRPGQHGPEVGRDREEDIVEQFIAEVLRRIDEEPSHRDRIPATRRMMNERELASLLNCDVRTVRRWEISGDIPRAIRVGGAKRWRPETIDEWLQSIEERQS